MRFNHDPFEYSGGFYEPRVTAFRGCTQDSRGPPGPTNHEPRTTSHEPLKKLDIAPLFMIY